MDKLELTKDQMKAIAASATRSDKALKALREIHFFLWPEQYPAKKAKKHEYWDGVEDAYQWNSDTIQVVSEMVSEALADDPATPKGGS
jgi:hypothetical protein